MRYPNIPQKKISLALGALICLVGLLAGCGGGGSKSSSQATNSPGPTPSVSGITPATGTVGTELTITGAQFRAGVQVTIGGIAMDSIVVVSDTQIIATVPNGTSFDNALDIVVQNSDGTQVTFAGAFTTVPPVLDFVNSATKPSGNVGSTVILEGDAFGDLQGGGQVLFSDGAGGQIDSLISSTGDWTNTFIVTTVPNGAADGPVSVMTATGESGSLPFKVTTAAAFSPSTIAWTSTTPLPVGVSGHQVVYVPIDDMGGVTNQFVHVVGGAADDGVPRTTVDVAAVQGDGTLGAWTATTALPAERAFHSLVAATPFNSKVSGSGQLYAVGGLDVDGAPTTTVYRASLNEDGTVGDWTETTALPVAVHSAGIAIFRGAIYLAGGATTDNNPVASVYRARPGTDGDLGAWDELPALPSPRAYHDLVTFGGWLYAVGGETAAVTADDGSFAGNATKLAEVALAEINLRNGDLNQVAWTLNATSLGKTRSKHSALAAGGNLFVTSGLYNGAGNGSSENTYAQINADGTVGSFAGATGSNTLQSEGGANLFNQSAIGYVDGNGVAHVMILGGDDVVNPGTKRTNVMFY